MRFATGLFRMAEASFEGGQLDAARAYPKRYHAAANPNPQSLWLGIQIERVLGDRNAQASYELMLRGKPRLVRFIAAPLSDGHGRQIGAIETLFDITNLNANTG